MALRKPYSGGQRPGESMAAYERRQDEAMKRWIASMEADRKREEAKVPERSWNIFRC